MLFCDNCLRPFGTDASEHVAGDKPCSLLPAWVDGSKATLAECSACETLAPCRNVPIDIGSTSVEAVVEFVKAGPQTQG